MQNSFVQVYATSISITSLAKRKRFAISPLPTKKSTIRVCDGMEVFSSLSGVSPFSRDACLNFLNRLGLDFLLVTNLEIFWDPATRWVWEF